VAYRLPKAFFPVFSCSPSSWSWSVFLESRFPPPPPVLDIVRCCMVPSNICLLEHEFSFSRAMIFVFFFVFFFFCFGVFFLCRLPCPFSLLGCAPGFYLFFLNKYFKGQSVCITVCSHMLPSFSCRCPVAVPLSV